MIDTNIEKWLVLTHGRWGRGDTVAEAAENCRKAGGKLSDKTYVELILGDKVPGVNSDGWIERAGDSTAIRLGFGLRLGQLLKVIIDPKQAVHQKTKGSK